jgi:Skp family chaperone for outer membrane proteins
MKSKLILTSLILFLFCLNINAQRKQRNAILDSEKIINSLMVKEKFDEQVELKFKTLEKEYYSTEKETENRVSKLREEFRKKTVGKGESEIKVLEKELNTEFEKTYKQAELEKEKIEKRLKTFQEELLFNLKDKMEKAIEEIKKDNRIKYVIYKNDPKGQPIVLYEDLETKEEFNITDDVMQMLNLPTN